MSAAKTRLNVSYVGMPPAQAHEGTEPFALGFVEVLHVVEALAAAEQAAQGNHEHIDQLVFATSLDTRVGQLLQMSNQAESVMRLHPASCRHCIYKLQGEEITRVQRAYPHLNDDEFVARHRDEWLRG